MFQLSSCCNGVKVLVIGAKGMLGGYLVEIFSEGNEVLAWDRNDIDITDFHNSKFLILNSGAELLINAAAYNDVDRAESEPAKANQINGYAVGNLAKICFKLGIPLVHFSTDNVFDGEKKEGYQEADEPNPVSAYGRSKLLGERELLKNADKYYLIRLSRLFGKPAQSKTAKKSFVEVMLDLAQIKNEISVIDEEVSTFTYAYDLANHIKYILNQKMPYGIYHCVNSGGATWYEVAKEIFKIRGVTTKLNPVSSDDFSRLAKRPRFSILLNTKLPVMRSWQEALQEFLKSESGWVWKNKFDR